MYIKHSGVIFFWYDPLSIILCMSFGTVYRFFSYMALWASEPLLYILIFLREHPLPPAGC